VPGGGKKSCFIMRALKRGKRTTERLQSLPREEIKKTKGSKFNVGNNKKRRNGADTERLYDFPRPKCSCDDFIERKGSPLPWRRTQKASSDVGAWKKRQKPASPPKSPTSSSANESLSTPAPEEGEEPRPRPLFAAEGTRRKTRSLHSARRGNNHITYELCGSGQKEKKRLPAFLSTTRPGREGPLWGGRSSRQGVLPGAGRGRNGCWPQKVGPLSHRRKDRRNVRRLAGV